MDMWNEVRSAPGVEILWDRDVSESYETDVQCLIRRADGSIAYVWASGCSCWEGDAQVEEMDSLDHALGPFGVPFDVRDEAFRDLCRAHGAAPEIDAAPTPEMARAEVVRMIGEDELRRYLAERAPMGDRDALREHWDWRASVEDRCYKALGERGKLCLKIIASQPRRP